MLKIALLAGLLAGPLALLAGCLAVSEDSWVIEQWDCEQIGYWVATDLDVDGPVFRFTSDGREYVISGNVRCMSVTE